MKIVFFAQPFRKIMIPLAETGKEKQVWWRKIN